MSEQWVTLKDGLHIITLWTGAPLPDKNRTGPSTAVVAGDKVFVVDSGPWSTRNLELTLGANIDAFLVTHFHSDHIWDMGELMLKRWTYKGESKPLPIYGPVGIEEVVAGFEQAYRQDVIYRVDHHWNETMPLSGAWAEVISFDLGYDLMSSKVIYDQDGVKITAFNVDHSPVYPAVWYKFEYKGKSLAIGGDTIYTESLVKHIEWVDVFVSESLNKDFADLIARNWPKDNNASIVAHDIKDYHLTPEEAAEAAKKAWVNVLIITHILPPLHSKYLYNGFLGDAKDIYSWKIHIANDGTLISLDTNTDKVKIKELLK